MRSYFVTSYSLVNAIRAFVFHEKYLSYARILREESLFFALNENSRFICQGLKRYANYSNSISLPFAKGQKHIYFVVAAASHFVSTIK